MTRILVTGGAGFIGSHIVDACLSRGDDVCVLDDLSTGARTNLEHVRGHENLELVTGDVTDAPLVERLIAKTDQVVHLAAAVGVSYIMKRQVQGILTNTVGTENVLRSAAAHGVKFFLASSSEVYGKNPEVPASEKSYPVLGTTDIHRWSYACAKTLDEFLALAYHREQGLPLIIGRFFNVTGPRQSPSYGMVLPRFIEAAQQAKELRVYGDGSQTRAFVHVLDACAAVLALLSDERANGQVYNIGSQESVSMYQLAQRVCEQLKSSSEIRFVSYEEAFPGGQFEDITHRVPAVDKIREQIGWQASYSLADIIAEMSA